MHSSTIATAAAVLAALPVMGLPSLAANVQVLDANIKGPVTAILPHIPANLPTAQKEVLDKYQPVSLKASAFIGEKSGNAFTSAGQCFAEYPCFSVVKAATASLGGSPAISQQQLDGLIANITSSPTIGFNQTNKDRPYNGFKLTSNGFIFQVLSAPRLIPSDVAAGIIFD